MGEGGEGVRAQDEIAKRLANNELEIANLAYSTLGIAVQNAGLDDRQAD